MSNATDKATDLPDFQLMEELLAIDAGDDPPPPTYPIVRMVKGHLT
jgi:hypothetical protein